MSQESGKKIPWKELGSTQLLLLAAAIIGLLLLAWPGGQSGAGKNGDTTGNAADSTGTAGASDNGLTGNGDTPVSATPEDDYAGDLENRLKKLLVSMDGVGEVEVMITLKTSEEIVLQTDTNISANTTSEQDSAGGSRQVEEVQTDQSTVLAGGSSGTPYVVQQIMPQVEGIVVLCDGGGQPAVKTEISEAVSALFDVPAHKIKVLKRVSGKS